jgi:molybdenum cofactor cytidylyltransferase
MPKLIVEQSHMNLAKALRISYTPSIAFVGAGGKTTAMFQLASVLRVAEGPIIVTATTRLGAWQIPLADHHIIAESPAPIEAMEHSLSGITLITGSIENDKTTPITEYLLDWLHEFCGYHDLPLLIEADGSKQKPLKAPAEHEPAIPEFVDQVVYVVGLSGLGKPLTKEHVHRPEIFSHLSGLNLGETITAASLIRVLTHSAGGLKNIPPRALRCLLLNQADTPELQSIGGKMAGELLEQFNSITVGTLKPSNLQTFEPIAGIILAAGESKRYGQPKQLLDWRGQPFIRAVAQTALAAGLSPVIVVTGANAEQVENAVKDLDVKIVRNKDWQSGQSSSVKAGVQALPQYTGASCFLLADQPQIGTDIIHSLAEAHARKLNPIIAPLVLEERRANPVLFDKATFPDLLKLEGDVGGRAIFSKYKVEYIPWHDDRLLLDVDEPEDYQRLVEDETL